MNDTIVIYATRTGHSRRLADELGAMIEAPVHEVKDASGHKGLSGFLRAGSEAAKRLQAPMVDPLIDLTGVKTVVFVQPIWASNLSPVLRTWLEAHRSELEGARFAMLASQWGSPPERFRSNVEDELGQLLAFATIPQSAPLDERNRVLQGFADQL